jgi:hypothetical protein
MTPSTRFDREIVCGPRAGNRLAAGSPKVATPVSR